MRISLIGTGNLGTHLATALHSKGHNIVQVCGRNAQNGNALAEGVDSEFIPTPEALSTDVDIILLTVSDSAIESVSKALPPSENAIVAHTAGSISSTVLSPHKNHGVFYPLQTFTKGRMVDWSTIPLLITGSNSDTTSSLKALAQTISGKVQQITDDERLHLHLCATIANNFANHMFAVAKSISESAQLDFDLLKPLIRETAQKALEIDPAQAQTGPALRGDQTTMAKHLALLADDPALRELYRVISASIQSGTIVP